LRDLVAMLVKQGGADSVHRAGGTLSCVTFVSIVALLAEIIEPGLKVERFRPQPPVRHVCPAAGAHRILEMIHNQAASRTRRRPDLFARGQALARLPAGGFELARTRNASEV
jgi:hypothetical protein